MPKIKSNIFSIQSNKTYRILSEFLNILDQSCLISINNFFFSKDILIIGTVFSNKIFLFLKVNYKMFLINSFVENNELISFINVSNSGDKIFISTIKNNIFIYCSNINGKQHNQNAYENLKYSKKIDFFNKHNNDCVVSSVCFNNDETFLAISYNNKKLRVFNLKKEEFFEINLNNIFKIFFIQADNYSIKKIYGKTISNHYIEYQIKKKKIIFSKAIENFLNQGNYVVLQFKRYIESRCYCHNKKINYITLPILCEKILLISKNKCLIEYKHAYFLLTIGSGLLSNCELDFYSGEEVFKNKKKISKFFISSNKYLNFILSVTIESKKGLFLKPISEKHKMLVCYNKQLFNLGQVYDIKFYGAKNSIILATDDCFLNIFQGKNFYFRGKLSFGNSSFHKLEVRGNILVAINIIGQIIFWKMDSFVIITWINTPSENLSIFALSKEIKSEGIFIYGGKDCTVNLFKLTFNSQLEVKIQFLYKSKNHNNRICLISASKDGSIFATVSFDKKTFLWKKTHKNPYIELDNQKRSVWSVDFSPNDLIVSTGTSEGNIYFYNSANGFCLRKLSGHNSPITNCLFNLDGLHLYTSDSQGVIKVWKISSGICTNTITKLKGYIWGLAVNQNGTLIASSNANGEIIVMKDVGAEIFNNKKSNYQKFLKVQQKISCQKFNENFLRIFSNIFAFRDSIILFDFLKFLYVEFYYEFEKFFGLFIQNAEINSIKFLFRSIISWNLEKNKLFLSQKILSIVLKIISPIILQKVKFEIIDSLLVSTYNIKQLFFEYEKLSK